MVWLRSCISVLFFVVFIASVGSFYLRDSQDIFYCLFRAVAGYLGVPLDTKIHMSIVNIYKNGIYILFIIFIQTVNLKNVFFSHLNNIIMIRKYLTIKYNHICAAKILLICLNLFHKKCHVS